jgi:mRNA interferase MazF
MNLLKFDVVQADFNPKKGHVQAGVRPAIVVQSNLFNQYSSTVLVVPLTKNEKKLFPSEFLIIPSKMNGLKESSRFLGSHIASIDKSFILKKLGRLEEKYYSHLQEALRVSLDWDNDFV